ncbi:UDP-glucose 4-epimerase GalE [Ancylobacter radicis]|uniref:UDP-glucose 4-epimerase n=1 Tax=Ancylobacter radicis TaxID=2836179 RepID=A0ABS5R3Q9_9HYPH|nr:UDP-glucose 4-epimerase GalE [Ancylobacter radicis]MBS9476107.1 UDP-glucose 4-epimerase GalE [Ancylobacter radicis]
MNNNILVTGGAGYIGSHACKALQRAGYTPITFDNLETGWAEVVKFGPFEKGDLRDRARLDDVFDRWKPKAVMHFAALSQVGEAVRDPGKYWSANIGGAVTLLQAMADHSCRDIVFSSTCATYGDQDGVLLDEATPQRPINAYGASKRAIEDMISDFGATYGLNSVIFRYFNVAGADPEGEIGEFHTPETHLIPILLDVASGERDKVTIFGTDYPTPDGTCIRDYVHVSDLVDAHVAGVHWLEAGKGNRVFCLGSSRGFSVREVIAEAQEVTASQIRTEIGPRRGGDAARLVSGSVAAARDLGWQPARSTLSQMIEDAWRVHQTLQHPGKRAS